jgi:pimeloyl-ACP methyl ester carboxylesterase
MVWFSRVVAAAALAVVAWACLTAWPAIVHGHPAYAVLLVLTVVVAVISLVRSFGEPRERGGFRRFLRVVVLLLGVVWVGAIWWLRPFSAVEPALAAMQSDATVAVTESATDIVLAPTSDATGVGVLFQPGAKVEARAYAAVLRPLAESGTTVVIVKQPLSIAFLALGAFDSARSAHPDVTRWVVGGHSLGGTVAAIEAESSTADGLQGVAAGLLLYASYPATDMSDTLGSAVLSISASDDGLATPADIDASKANLPPNAEFLVIDGAVHAYFGDYGPQPGDGTPTISHDDARRQISDASVGFVHQLTP